MSAVPGPPMIFEISFELWVLIFLLGNQMGKPAKNGERYTCDVE